MCVWGGHRYIIFRLYRGGGGNLTGISGDIGAENWDIRGVHPFFDFFLIKMEHIKNAIKAIIRGALAYNFSARFYDFQVPNLGVKMVPGKSTWGKKRYIVNNM